MGMMIGIFVFLIIAMLLVVKYCKKILKNVLVILIILITLYCIGLSIDMNKVYSLEAPIFCYLVEDDSDGSFEGLFEERTEIYYGIGYKIVNEINENNAVISSTMYIFNKVVAGAIT